MFPVPEMKIGYKGNKQGSKQDVVYKSFVCGFVI